MFGTDSDGTSGVGLVVGGSQTLKGLVLRFLNGTYACYYSVLKFLTSLSLSVWLLIKSAIRDLTALLSLPEIDFSNLV